MQDKLLRQQFEQLKNQFEDLLDNLGINVDKRGRVEKNYAHYGLHDSVIRRSDLDILESNNRQTTKHLEMLIDSNNNEIHLLLDHLNLKVDRDKRITIKEK